MIKKAYKFRFYPTKKQKELLAKSFGCSGVVYNQALNFKIKKYQEYKENVSYSKTSAFLTSLKQNKEFLWLNEVSSVCLQQSLRDLDRAFLNFFKKRSNFPRFKNKHSTQAIRLTKSAFSWDGVNLKIAKSKDRLKIHWSRCFLGTPTGITITKDSCDRYFVSLLVEEEVIPFEKRNNSVGIDLGLTTFATLSTGKKITAPKPFRFHKKRLKRKQRSLSKAKVKGKNRLKKRRSVASIHSKIKNIRQDFHHKLSTKLARENQTITIEGLNINKMLKNKKLSKHISDAGWSRFLTFLKYKCEWYGRNIVELDQFFASSKLCSACRHQIEILDLSVRSWQCPNCKVTHDRDLNASINIDTAGQSVI